jgi:hypothetical protein
MSKSTNPDSSRGDADQLLTGKFKPATVKIGNVL